MENRSTSDEWTVAIHEAGHAVMHLVERIPFDEVTIDAAHSLGRGGAVRHAPVGSDEFDLIEDSKEQDALARRYMRIAWGGPIANDLAGQVLDDYQWQQDRLDLNDYGSRCVGSEERAYEDTRGGAREALRARWPAVERVARALVECRSLSPEQVSAIADL